LSLNEQLYHIDLKNKIAKTSKREIKFDRLISSIPFPFLLDICNVEYNKNFYSWNKVLVFNLGFDKKGRDTVNHWIYFPEKKYSFYRIGYYDNIYQTNKLSLYVELGFSKEKKVDSQEYLKRILKDLKLAEIIDDHKLVAYSSVIMNPAYVHISQDSENDKLEKMKLLSDYDIHSIGRYGEWTYCSIEDNIIQAKELTLKIFK